MLQDDLSLDTACPETDSSAAPVRRGVRHGVQRTRVKLNRSLSTQCLTPQDRSIRQLYCKTEHIEKVHANQHWLMLSAISVP